MHVTREFMRHSANVILFTRPNCSLCENAKVVIQSVSRLRSFEYREVNIMSHGQESWKQLYEFDTPVVHVQRVFHNYAKPNIMTEPRKLMHRFSEKDLESLIEEAEGSP
ncbi:MAG: hypothetical protein LQ349_009874, partial [Xanthoria aureola]